MAYLEKPAEPPPPWSRFRAATSLRWLYPFLFVEWIFRHIAYYLGKWSLPVVLEYIGSFSVLVAVVLYFTEAGERRQQKHYQAWQVINTAQGKGGSGGRINALQQLNQDGVPLTGVDARDAFLQDINLQNAELRRADFSGADLRNAHLRRARMVDADLSRSNLRGADLRQADLSGANLQDIDLTGADLGSANLTDARLNNADLTDANLTNLTGWQSAKGLDKANLTGARGAPPGLMEAARIPTTRPATAAVGRSFMTKSTLAWNFASGASQHKAHETLPKNG